MVPETITYEQANQILMKLDTVNQSMQFSNDAIVLAIALVLCWLILRSLWFAVKPFLWF